MCAKHEQKGENPRADFKLKSISSYNQINIKNESSICNENKIEWEDDTSGIRNDQKPLPVKNYSRLATNMNAARKIFWLPSGGFILVLPAYGAFSCLNCRKYLLSDHPKFRRFWNILKYILKLWVKKEVTAIYDLVFNLLSILSNENKLMFMFEICFTHFLLSLWISSNNYFPSSSSSTALS